MKIGIIIPTYDNLKMLRKLIKQVLQYTVGDFMLIVIEDGANIKTRNWLLKQERVNSIFHPTNKGVATSWNDGLKMAANYGCSHFVVMNDDVSLPKDWQRCLKGLDDADLVFLNQLSPITFTGWFFAMTEKCLKRVGHFDEDFVGFCSEDFDWWLRFLRSRLNYTVSDIGVVHGGSATLSKIRKERPEHFRDTWNQNWLRLRRKYPHLKFQDNLLA